MIEKQPQYTVVSANPGWWAKIRVDGKSGPDDCMYEPVAFWMVYHDPVMGVVIDAPQAVTGGGDSGGHGRLSEMSGFQGFVFEPMRNQYG